MASAFPSLPSCLSTRRESCSPSASRHLPSVAPLPECQFVGSMPGWCCWCRNGLVLYVTSAGVHRSLPPCHALPVRHVANWFPGRHGYYGLTVFGIVVNLCLVPVVTLLVFLLFVTSIGVFLVCVTRGPCLSWMW